MVPADAELNSVCCTLANNIPAEIPLAQALVARHNVENSLRCVADHHQRYAIAWARENLLCEVVERRLVYEREARLGRQQAHERVLVVPGHRTVHGGVSDGRLHSAHAHVQGEQVGKAARVARVAAQRRVRFAVDAVRVRVFVAVQRAAEPVSVAGEHTRERQPRRPVDEQRQRNKRVIVGQHNVRYRHVRLLAFDESARRRERCPVQHPDGFH